MKREFHLSHILDEKGIKRIDLLTFHELSKLDSYIMRAYKDHKQVRESFDLDIGEFCLDNKDFIQEENRRNHRNWTGSITIICEEKDASGKTTAMYKIPIIYKNDRKLLPKEDCLNKIKMALKDYRVMLTIYYEKKDLLSQNEIDLIDSYIKFHNEKKLKSAIGFFYNRLKRMDNDETLYTYCRALMHVCKLNLLSIKTKFGSIDVTAPSLPDKTIIVKRGNFPNKTKIDRLISEENYEELFNLYDIDEIDINSDLFRRVK